MASLSISQRMITRMNALSITRPHYQPLLQLLRPSCQQCTRAFSSTPSRLDWLLPKRGETKKSRKGRPHVQTGGSVRGTTVVWGDYGLRMRDHHRRIPAQQLRIAEATIKQRMRGQQYKLYKRISANIGVYSSGNEVRMGKGKGSFDYWASRVSVSKIIFELKGNVHEQIVRDAFRLAGNKLPGLYEFVKKGDPPVVGITQLGNGVTMEDLLRPRKKIPLDATTSGLSSTTPSVPSAAATSAAA